MYTINDIYIYIYIYKNIACIIDYHNMVGVAVAMVISTMHEKSCIDLHNVRKFEKRSKIKSFTYLAIAMMKLWK